MQAHRESAVRVIFDKGGQRISAIIRVVIQRLYPDFEVSGFPLHTESADLSIAWQD